MTVMTQKAFFPQFNEFCLKWATPIPGAVTTYGGPLRFREPGFQAELKLHKEEVFEQLLLFDSLQFNITGPNVICPLMYEFMGEKPSKSYLNRAPCRLSFGSLCR